MRGSNTASGADGKAPDTAFAFAYPYPGPAKLWFRVTVVSGGTRSDASEVYGPVVMGALRGGAACAPPAARLWCWRTSASCTPCAWAWHRNWHLSSERVLSRPVRLCAPMCAPQARL